MNKNFRLSVNSQLHFETFESEALNLDVIKDSENNYHVLKNGKSYRFKLNQGNFHRKKYAVELDSKTYQIQISNELDKLIKTMGFSDSRTKHLDSVIAPMPGVILDLKVRPGDLIKEGEILLILEAMKMENAILCPKDSKVKSVFVSIDDSVEKGKLLIEFE